MLLKKIAFVLQFLLLLVEPRLSVVNEVLSKVWRKLNTFLRSEARNLESSRQKPVDFFWKSVFARPLRHGAITVYYLTSLLS